MAHRNLPGRDGQRRASGNARALPARAASAGNRPSDDLDTLLALAREAGCSSRSTGRSAARSIRASWGRFSRCSGSPRRSAREPKPTRRPCPSRVARRARAGRMRIVCAAARAAHARRSVSLIRIRGYGAARAAGTTCDRFFVSSDLSASPTHGTRRLPCPRAAVQASRFAVVRAEATAR